MQINNAAFASNGYNLSRFNEPGGKTYRADFPEVAFGDTNWDEPHVAIDPDRLYALSFGDIDIYELNSLTHVMVTLRTNKGKDSVKPKILLERIMVIPKRAGSTLPEAVEASGRVQSL